MITTVNAIRRILIPKRYCRVTYPVTVFPPVLTDPRCAAAQPAAGARPGCWQLFIARSATRDRPVHHNGAGTGFDDDWGDAHDRVRAQPTTGARGCGGGGGRC